MVFDSLPSDLDRARIIADDAYASFLAKECNVEPVKAATHVAFRRGAHPAPVLDVVLAHLPALTAELVTEGSSGTVIDAGYAEALAAA